MLLVRLLAVLVVSFSLLGCGMSTPPIKEHNSIEVPDGKNTKTIELFKITSRVSRGTHIGKIGEGWGCIYIGKMVWKSGRANVADEEVKSIFVEELKRFNYNVIGDPDNLFDNKSGRAMYQVGAVITNVRWDVCFLAGYLDGWSSGSTYVELDVEWQVYNALDKKTVYKCTSTGQGKADFSARDTDQGFQQALAHAVRGLMADKGFYSLVSGEKSEKKQGSPSDPPMGGLIDGPQDMSSRGNTSSAPDSPAGGVTASKSKTTPLSDIAKSVVVIQTPGAHGSGFFIDNQGHIITNQHVVDDEQTVRVILQNRTKVEGRVLARDAKRDVALVKVDSQVGVPLGVRLGDLPVGTDVFAIGAPIEMGMQGSVTKGIVSSYRPVNSKRMLQSDVAVFGGNSGGPLVDAQGRVVGICQSGMTATQGFNFFIPIDEGLDKLNVSAK